MYGTGLVRFDVGEMGSEGMEEWRCGGRMRQVKYSEVGGGGGAGAQGFAVPKDRVVVWWR